MDINKFELFALTICPCLLGMMVATWNNTNLITDREILLLIICHIVLLVTLSVRNNTKSAITTYLNQHSTSIASKQLADLQSTHRAHITQLKLAHNTQIQQLRQFLSNAQADLDRRDLEHEYMSTTYQDNVRLVQEQEDRIAYLEAKLHESGQVMAHCQMPYSAPASRVQFENPPHREGHAQAGRYGIVDGRLTSVLEQVIEAQDEML